MALGKENKKNKKNLCRVPDGGHSAKTDASGRRDPIRPYLSRANLPRARPSAKIYFAEGRLFAEGLALPRAPRAGPRQIEPLPSARDLALGK